MNFFDGWINVYKPKEITSFGVIKKIKKNFNISKLGHAGTLDPDAEGILPIAIGKATKLISFINNNKKAYEFNIKWGKQTTTDDSSGEVLEISNKLPGKKNIEKIISNFIGNIMQQPPKVSAIKINGKRAYDRYRNNEIFEIKKRLVKVYDLKLLDQIDKQTSRLFVECGKGFYVRSLARELAEILCTKAHICSLKRLKVGKFNKKNSILLDDLLKMRQMALGIKGFHSSISVLDDIPAFEIDNNEMLESISHGNKVKMNFDLSNTLIESNNKVCFAINNGNIISFGRIDGMFFKPNKVLL